MKSDNSSKIGYTRKEFGAIFQIYSQNVYKGLFRDFSFSEINGRYYISFREEAGKTPLITIEKKRLGPDRVLFIGTTPGPKNTIIEIARSEKIDAFVRQLKGKIEILTNNKSTNSSAGSINT
jgi:predicted transcriptional regulator